MVGSWQDVPVVRQFAPQQACKFVIPKNVVPFPFRIQFQKRQLQALDYVPAGERWSLSRRWFWTVGCANVGAFDHHWVVSADDETWQHAGTSWKEDSGNRVTRELSCLSGRNSFCCMAFLARFAFCLKREAPRLFCATVLNINIAWGCLFTTSSGSCSVEIGEAREMDCVLIREMKLTAWIVRCTAARPKTEEKFPECPSRRSRLVLQTRGPKHRT